MSNTSPAVLGALKHRNFTLYLVARFIATLAMQMQSVAVGWQVYAITNDPLDLGLIGLAQFLPFIVLVLPAGQIADRFDRRPILVACYVRRTSLCAALLLAFTLYGTQHRVAGVSRAGAVRRRARLRDADVAGDHAEPGAARDLRQRGRAEFVDVSRRDDRRPVARRAAVRGRTRHRVHGASPRC